MLIAANESPRVCYVGNSKANQNHRWRWILTEFNPCDCTKLFTADKLDITPLLVNMMGFYGCKMPGRSVYENSIQWSERTFSFYLKRWINWKLFQICVITVTHVNVFITFIFYAFSVLKICQPQPKKCFLPAKKAHLHHHLPGPLLCYHQLGVN